MTRHVGKATLTFGQYRLIGNVRTWHRLGLAGARESDKPRRLELAALPESAAAHRSEIDAAVQRFQDVKDPALSRITDFGVLTSPDESERYIVVYELIEGPTVGDSLRERAFDVARTLTIVNSITSGLASLHRAGLAHGAIGLESVIETSARAVLTGAGLAQFEKLAVGTNSGGAAGTSTADIRALGQLMAAMVSGDSSLSPLGPRMVSEGDLGSTQGRRLVLPESDETRAFDPKEAFRRARQGFDGCPDALSALIARCDTEIADADQLQAELARIDLPLDSVADQAAETRYLAASQSSLAWVLGASLMLVTVALIAFALVYLQS